MGAYQACRGTTLIDADCVVPPSYYSVIAAFKGKSGRLKLGDFPGHYGGGKRAKIQSMVQDGYLIKTRCECGISDLYELNKEVFEEE